MRIIIAGSRTITDYDKVDQSMLDAIGSNFVGLDIEVILCGCAKGVDSLGEQWAQRHGIQVEYYPAEWDKYGKSAGYRRNVRMAEHADALILVWDGKSKGSKHMLNIAKEQNLKIFEKII